MDYSAPFDTYLRETPDFNGADFRAETQLLLQRQTALDQLLRGQISESDYLDVINDQGLSPDAYIDMACDNVEHVIATGQQASPDDVRLFLPDYLCRG